MTERKYQSRINFENGELNIAVTYERVTNVAEAQSLKIAKQRMIANETGAVHPLEEIIVHPDAGEIATATSMFFVKLGEPLPHSVHTEFHKNAPYVLPLLIKDLEKYRDENIGEPNVQLANYAIKGLTRIVESGEAK